MILFGCDFDFGGLLSYLACFKPPPKKKKKHVSCWKTPRWGVGFADFLSLPTSTSSNVAYNLKPQNSPLSTMARFCPNPRNFACADYWWVQLWWLTHDSSENDWRAFPPEGSLKVAAGVGTSCQLVKCQNKNTWVNCGHNCFSSTSTKHTNIVAHHIFVARDEALDPYALAKSQGKIMKKLDSLLIKITYNSVLEPSATSSRLFTIPPAHQPR